MTNKTISALTAATTPLAGTEVVPIVQGGVTVKVAVSELAPPGVNLTGPITSVGNATSVASQTGTGSTFVMSASPTISGDQTLSTGNLIQGTAGKGFNFTANTPLGGMTTQLLNWYEEGTWTPIYATGTGAFGTVTYNSNTFGRYTRIGKTVIVTGLIITDEFNIGTAAGQCRIGGLPYTPSPSSSASINYSVGFNTIHPSGGFTSGTEIFLTSRTTSDGASAALIVSELTTGVSAFKNYVYFTMNFVIA